MDIGVKGGKFWAGTELVQFTGASGVELADDKDAIYVYLNVGEVLLLMSIAVFLI